MKCPYCDQEHPEGTSFCPLTGKQILSNISCPNCGVVYDTQLAACPNCGTPMGLTLSPVVHPTVKQVPMESERTAPTQETSPGTVTTFPDELDAQPVQVMDTLPEQEALAPPLSTQPMNEVGAVQVTATPAGIEAKPVSSTNKPRRRYILGCLACGCVSMPLVVLVVLALIFLVDPFNLHVLGRINGRYDAAAEVMPANTGLYLGINIANALITRVDRRLTSFSPSDTTTDASLSLNFLDVKVEQSRINAGGPIDGLIQQIRRETGVKVPEDISPWIGQYAGIGVVQFKDNGYGSQIPSGWILAVEARNLSRADEFLTSLQDNLTHIKAMSFNNTSYNGTQVVVQEVNGELNGLSFGRAGRMILIASDFEVLKDAIDNKGTQQLSDQEEYNQLTDLRSRTWFASLYISHNVVGSLMEDVTMGGLASSAVQMITPLSTAPWSGMLLSAETIREGFRFDGYTIFDDQLPTTSGTVSVANWYSTPAETIQLLPQDTVVYLANSSFELFLQSFFSFTVGDPSESSYFFDAFEQLYGFSIKEELFDHLSGEWAIYAVPSTHGYLLGQEGINMAVGLLVQTDNQIDLQSMSDKLNQVGKTTGITVISNQLDGTPYYALAPVGDENPALLFSQGNGYFTLATSIDALQTSVSSETSLVNSESYQRVINYFPGGMHPSVYMDIKGLIANLREGMDTSELESFNDGIGILGALDMIASGNQVIQPGIAQSSIVVLLPAQ